MRAADNYDNHVGLEVGPDECDSVDEKILFDECVVPTRDHIQKHARNLYADKPHNTETCIYTVSPPLAEP